ncbi:MAG TPA: phosphodiester glycosidase family protein [Bacteroidota bacterium]|nr:phosphodiester glycosidase family protein [Bacteroidota bacterium]
MKYFIYIKVFILFSFFSISYSQTIDYSKPDTIQKNEINSSIIHYRYVYNSIPWNINIIEINSTDKNYSILSVKSSNKIHNSREKVSDIVKRNRNKNITIGINADFFYPDGDIVNNQISEGEFVKGIKSNRSQIAFTFSNEPFINIFSFSGKLILKDNKEISIDALNQKRGFDSIVIYNKYWGNSTNTGGSGIEYVFIPIDSTIANKPFRAVIKSILDSNATITNNQYVLSASDNKKNTTLSSLQINDTILISLNIQPDINNVKELVGGLPQIIKDGINIAHSQALKEGANEKFSLTRHPRTAIGYSRDKAKLYLITVDGRQKCSAGMTLNELSEFMLFLGCYNALNLDGGGSTTLVINDKIINYPSDLTGERPVGNALLIISN